MELWERSEALDLLDRLLQRSAKGGRVAVVAGEAGLGKSSLLIEFARRSTGRARVLWGACDPLVTPRALGPLHDIGRQTGGPLAARLGGAAAQEEIFAAFLDEMAGPHQRLRPVVVVEDAHWADEATLDWLSFTARRMDRLPALLVVTYRDDEVGPEHPLRGALAALPAAITHRVPLAPLSQECVLEQTRRAGRDAAAVYRRSGGNPLLVTELLKADGAAVPGAVQDLILDRIRALPGPARDLAQLVSVVPTRAEAVVAGSSDAVDICIGAGVLVPSEDGVAFRHELLRSAVEDALSPARRIELHRRVLGILVGVEGVDPGRLVHHARSAGDVDAILRYGQVAGASAARQGAHREAAGHYRAAAAHADRLPAAERAELLERYAYEAHLTGRNEEALQVREAALAIREALGQPDRAGEDLRWISRLAWWCGQVAYARRQGARAVAVLESLPPSRQLAMAYSNQAQLHLTTHELDAAVSWAVRARTLAEELGDEATATHARITEQTAGLTGDDPAAAAAALEELHVWAADRGLVQAAMRALGNVALGTADELSEYAAAAPLVDRVLAYTERHGLEVSHLQALGARAKLRLERLEWPGALADAEATLARSGPLGVNGVLPLVVIGRIQAARGHPDALATLDQAERAAVGVGDVPMVVPVADARSEYFLLNGDPERAREEARRGLEYAGSERGGPFIIGRLAYRLWRAGGTDEVPATAARPYQHMIGGQWAEAAAEWGRRGGAYLRVEALSAGDEDAASLALRTLDELGASRAAEHLRGELRKRGFAHVPRGPRRATTANAAGLTPRQVDVLALLADGLSNAEIAGRLTVSPKTVDHHVSAVLRKLGVVNRGQAAAAARHRNLLP